MEHWINFLGNISLFPYDNRISITLTKHQQNVNISKDQTFTNNEIKFAIFLVWRHPVWQMATDNLKDEGGSCFHPTTWNFPSKHQ
jgi:hypothetical protein